MKTHWMPILGLVAVGVAMTAGCRENGVLPSGTSSVGATESSFGLASEGVASEMRATRNYRAHLSGREEVPPRDVLGQGQAILQFSKDGQELHFKVNVANVQNVIGLHIHLAPAGQNGPIVLPFIGNPLIADADAITTTGTIVEGTATSSDLGGTLAGMTLQDLRSAMANGMTYVNVHTIANRGGEIRGQIR